MLALGQEGFQVLHKIPLAFPLSGPNTLPFKKGEVELVTHDVQYSINY
jgi:hypothetical protein